MSNSPGLADFAIGLVNSVQLNLPDGHSEVFWGYSNNRRTVINATHKKCFFGLVKMLVHASYSLPN